jgi:hypothetical protein
MPYLDPAAGAAREVYSSSGAPGAGTDEVQTITIGGTPTGGSFKLGFGGFTTAAIAWNATNGTLVGNIDAALEALPSLGVGAVVTAVGTMTAGIGTITVTFSGVNVSKRAIATMTVVSNDLIGTAPTVAVAETTPGVDADGRGASKGSTLIRADTGARYQNLGTPAAPNWSAL